MSLKQLKRLILIIVISLSLFQCDTTTEPEGKRIGAVCNDGTTSTATGSGACSSHGGVDHWIYE